MATTVRNATCQDNTSFYKGTNQTAYIDDPCQRTTDSRNYILALYYILVIIFGLLGNTLTIVVILLSRHLRSQRTYCFLISLAVADNGVSLFVTTLKVDMSFHDFSFCFSDNLCQLFIYVDILFPSSSIMHLLVITIDRYCAITKPFLYTAKFTTSNAKTVILVTWVYVILWSALGMFPWQKNQRPIGLHRVNRGIFCINENKLYFTFLSVHIYFIPMIVIVALYLIILNTASKQNKKIKAEILSCMPNSSQSTNSQCKRSKIRDMKATKTVFFVFAAFTVSFLPMFTIIILQYWTNTIKIFYETNPLAYHYVMITFNAVLPVFNSCINPFIYFIFGSQFRSAFKNILYKRLGKSRNGILYPDVSIASNSSTVQSMKNERVENHQNAKSEVATALHKGRNKSSRKCNTWLVGKCNRRCLSCSLTFDRGFFKGCLMFSGYMITLRGWIFT